MAKADALNTGILQAIRDIGGEERADMRIEAIRGL
jgi:hypothetical protein